MRTELIINEAIRNRQDNYINVIKKELVLAQSIIKTPMLLKHTTEKFNFEEIETYKRELVLSGDGNDN